MSQMGIGEIGVLQNLVFSTNYNNELAEIEGLLKKGDCIICLDDHRAVWAAEDGYYVRVLVPIPGTQGTLAISKNQIRPLSDPDQEDDLVEAKESDKELEMCND